MRFIKIVVGIVLTSPLIAVIAWLIKTMTIPFLIEHGIIGGMVWVGSMIIITLVLVLTVLSADAGINLIKGGKK